jgi:putative tryptophan/tyrosine transport system substrate-binding protein
MPPDVIVSRAQGRGFRFDPKQSSPSLIANLASLRGLVVWWCDTPFEPRGAVTRRKFITLIGATTVSWPFLVRAQQSRLPIIGFFRPNTAAIDGPRVNAMVQRLQELGWVAGRTVAIEYRWAEGRNNNLADIAAELVRLKADVIVTSATPTTVATKKATSAIPIVFASVGNPIGAGLVQSLARPGGNATGLSPQQSDTAGKRLELLRELVPGVRQVAIIANVDNARAPTTLSNERSRFPFSALSDMPS